MFEFFKKNKMYIILFFVTFTLWFFVDENGPFYAFSNYIDVSIYYNIGKMLTHGKELYFDLVDTKGPYMFFIGAISYLLNKDFLFFFILDLCSIMTFMFFNFKILKKYFNDKVSFIFTLFCFFIFSKYFDYFGSPEFLIIGIISIFIYWLLDDGFSKENSKIFLVFGIFSSFILLTKINYLLGFGIIAICYIINSFVKKKKIIKELLFFCLGFVLGCIPLIIYDFINGKFLSYFIEYIKLCVSYSNQEYLFSFPDLFFVIIMIISILLFVNFFKYKNFNYIYVFLFFVGVITSILITKRFYLYYIYLLVPFFVFVFISFKANIKHMFFKMVIMIFLFIYFLYNLFFGYFGALNFREINKDINNNYVYSFYNDYKDKVTDDSIIFGYLFIDTGVATYFENQPTYKYYHCGNNSYEDFKEIYDEYLYLLKNKKADFVIASQLNGEFNRFMGLFKYPEYINEMDKILNENYILDKEYEYNGFIKQVYIPKEDK